MVAWLLRGSLLDSNLSRSEVGWSGDMLSMDVLRSHDVRIWHWGLLMSLACNSRKLLLHLLHRERWWCLRLLLRCWARSRLFRLCFHRRLYLLQAHHNFRSRPRAPLLRRARAVVTLLTLLESIVIG